MPIDIKSPEIQMALRSNNPIMVGDVPVQHVPFSKITHPSIGYSRYRNLLGLFCITKENVKENIKFEMDLPVFLYVLLLSKQDDNFKSALSDACNVFLGNRPQFDYENALLIFNSEYYVKCSNCSNIAEKKSRNSICGCGGVFLPIPSFVVDSDNFDDIALIVRLRNGLISNEEEEMSNPASEKARQIIARRNEIRRKRAKAFQEKNKINTWDVLDAYTAAGKMSYEEVMKFDPYQISVSLARIKAIDDYDIAIQSAVHGAQNVTIKHWLSPLDDNNEEKQDE